MNNDNHMMLICPRCGAKNKATNVLCIKCGLNFHTNNLRIVPGEDPLEKQVRSRINDKRGNVALLIAILNLLIVFPFAIRYSVFFAKSSSSALSKVSINYIILLVATGYTFASVMAVVSFIVNFITRGRLYRAAVVAIVASFIAGVIFGIIMNKFYI